MCFETTREKVRAELDMYVDLLGFIDLFEFVVNMGANNNPFIPQLLEFGSKFVDHKQRQLSLQAFAEVNKVGLQFPLRQDSHGHAILQETTEQNLVPSSRDDLDICDKGTVADQARCSATLLPVHMQARSRGHAIVEVGFIDSKRGLRGSRRIHHVQRGREGGGCHDVGGGEVLR